jgi:predicted anti-sigma-YlaC factor YlaD
MIATIYNLRGISSRCLSGEPSPHPWSLLEAPLGRFLGRAQSTRARPVSRYRSTRRYAIAIRALMVFAAAACSACSLKKTAVDMVGDAISGGSGVYTSDNDPELVREAIPFGLKTYESLLAVSPEHQGVLLAAATGFVGYAYILVQEADQLEAADLSAARALRSRASKLFLRGRDYALRGLEVAHRSFRAEFDRNPTIALAMTNKKDVAFLYWAGAGWAGALGANKRDPQLIAGLPSAGALVGRALELDETYDGGAAHEFFVTYEGSRPGGNAQTARQHFDRALQLSKGERASLYLALAESVCLHEQNLEEFRSLLRDALAVDPDAVPDLRLVNTLAVRRARWLENRLPELFVRADLTE